MKATPKNYSIAVVDRRGFLKGILSAGALVLGARILPTGILAKSDAESATWSPNIWLGLEPNGSVIIVAHRSEMGTGIRSSLPAVVADELDADWSKVRIEQAVGAKKYGSQNTDGSCSIRDFFETMRQAGATARHLLLQAAARQWKVPVTECRTDKHQVVHNKSDRRIGYGELAAAAAQLEVPHPADLEFKKESEYRYIGKPFPVSNIRELCSGQGVFGIDSKMPGMVHASVERSPVYGGRLKSYDDSETLKVKGVLKTVVLDGFKPPHGFQALGGVAVIADNTWSAIKGREALKVTWEDGPHATYDSASYKKALMETVNKPQKAVRNVGDVQAEFDKRDQTHEARYYVPHLAHAPMEPPAALVKVEDGKALVYAATQNPQAVQDTVAQALGIPQDDVECHVTLLGGGFGRKSKPDYVAEAALLSQALGGKPVKVTWTREDDIRFDYFHSVAAMYLKAAVDDKGKPTALLQRVAFPSIGTTFDASATHAATFEMGMGWVDVPYAIPNIRAENGPAKNHVRIGWLRAVANIYQAFAVHSFMDELAARAKRDRVEFLLDALGPARIVDFKAEGTEFWNNGKSLDDYPVDTGRLRRVIELAAEKSGWNSKKPRKGRALGIAAHRSFLSYIAAVADVEVGDDGRVRIHRVDLAVDVGKVINPDRVKSQFEGAAVFGTSIALMSKITAAKGRIEQSNFDDYRVARLTEAPLETHVHIVPSDELPAGVGEPGVPPIPPAICNAIFAATGKRIRELPVEGAV